MKQSHHHIQNSSAPFGNLKMKVHGLKSNVLKEACNDLGAMYNLQTDFNLGARHLTYTTTQSMAQPY